MAKPKIRPPSAIDALPFPVFGLSWYGTPSNRNRRDSSTHTTIGCSAVAYCGGGGSSKTGVLNKIVVLVTTDNINDVNVCRNIEENSSIVTRQIEISTGDALCFGIHLFRPNDGHDDHGMLRLLACVGDEVWLYGIPIHDEKSTKSFNATASTANGEAVQEGKVLVGSGYGANVATYTAIYKNGRLNHHIAVGCENGRLLIYQLELMSSNHSSLSSSISTSLVQFHKIAECTQHTKAICAVHFHPRGLQVLSSAKDGTARVFSAESGVELGIMECEVHDPKDPPPDRTSSVDVQQKKDPRMMKGPAQILVRGCAYGDLEGKTIYTIASGKKGPAYLTKWHTMAPLNSNNYPSTPSSTDVAENHVLFCQEYRIQCSPVPISATCLSPDGILLTLGSVEGSVLLFNLETRLLVKQFQGHDLPVTCLASRPIPNVLFLPGELELGVNYDVMSASVDNRLGKWTLQKKSRRQQQQQQSIDKRTITQMESIIWRILRILLLLIATLVGIAIHDIHVICREEVTLFALTVDPKASWHCIYREVLWAESSRPGVRSVPE